MKYSDAPRCPDDQYAATLPEWAADRFVEASFGRLTKVTCTREAGYHVEDSRTRRNFHRSNIR
ncbi:hypothetical protein EV191_10553 [Tamaricihabitans halophyticus]|uniref:Uncharacterized protein n=1 Tax=Tamaricihabitans halophyticus TaxID=1262583 RepID=A0A4R2QSW0_9PSEU|nr:hypothetical protein EV191_10553 [Tamaricihabitans halophyticus]